MTTYFELAETYNSYAGTDIVVTAQLAYLGNDNLKSKCYVLGSLQTISISTYQDKKPVRAIGNINAIDYVMGQRTIAGSLVFAVFDRHFADEIFNDLKGYTGKVVLLTDEIPPLDLTIVFANEYGKKSKMVLYGVRMLSEGQVMSINDLYTENTYQFIALGMEPLSAENTEYESSTNDNTPETDDGTDPTNTNNDPSDTNKNNNKDNNSNNSYNNDNDNAYEKTKISYIYYKINNPITSDGKGIINLDISNKTGSYINIFNKDTNEKIIYDYETLKANNWYITLPQGEYSIKYVNPLEHEYSEENDISIKYKTSTNEKNDYIIVNYLTNNSLYLDSNNSTHDKLIVQQDEEATSDESYEEDDVEAFKFQNYSIEEIPVVKNKIFVSNLESNKVYKFYTTNGFINSKVNYVKTLSIENEDLLMLIDYVKYNKPLWVNDFSDFNFDLLYNEGLTLLDKVINLNDSIYKQELLLYAIKLQNELINTFNKTSELPRLINIDLLNIDLKTNDEINKIIIYDCINNNEYFKYTINSLSNNAFIGSPNKKYIYQPISNNIKGIKYNYCFIEKSEKERLKKYTKKYYLENQDILKYKNKYVNYDDELLKTILVKDRNYPNKYILEGPAFTYDDLLIVDVNYKDFLKQDEDYYLCIGLNYDVLNYTPIRKIKFSKDDSELILEDYKTGIINNNYYLLWIENNNFEKISSSTIMSTYSDTKYLEDFRSIYIKESINEIQKNMLSLLSCKDLLNSISFSLLSYNLFPKNIIHSFEQELVNQGYYSLYSNNLDHIFFTLLKNINLNTKKLCDKAIISNDEISFINPNNCKVVIIDYYLDNDLPIIYDSDSFEINLNKNNLYTVIYLRSDNMVDNSGFILINNINSKYYNYNIEVEEVK